MASPIPDPTPEELYDELAASGIRLDKIWSGVKEVLYAKMPGMTTRYNLKNKRHPGLQAPERYYTGGVNLGERFALSIIVGSESEFSSLGPGIQSTSNTTCVWVVTPAKTTQALTRDAAILAHLAHGVLMGYQCGYKNRLGQRLWTGLAPGSVRSIPKDKDSLYGGFYLTLDIAQGPDPSSTSLYESGEDVDDLEP